MVSLTLAIRQYASLSAVWTGSDHVVEVDDEYRGYYIPAGTAILTNLRFDDAFQRLLLTVLTFHS